MLTRPSTAFSELGTKAIDQGLADAKLSAFYESIMSASPAAINDALRPYVHLLSLCSDRVTEFAPPPIFYVGKDSSQRVLFGEDWAKPILPVPQMGLRTPDPDLEQASADGYRAALSGNPYYGYARTLVTVDGEQSEIAFERLIVAFRPSEEADYSICAYFGVIQDLQRKI